MNRYQNKTLPVYMFFLFALGLLVILSFSDTATAQPACGVTICKSAPQLPPAESEVDAVFFPFTDISGQTVTEFTLAANGRCTGRGLEPGQSAEIIEDPFEGWQLVDIECDTAPGVSTTFSENGVSVECLSEGFITCTFINLRVPAIPTLSEWGMLAAAAGLALIAVFFAIKRRKAQAV
ncbi:MAG: IPTL-CTERM sorting domain-containing protein [Thermodesulfobacteriota bacterium]